MILQFESPYTKREKAFIARAINSRYLKVLGSTYAMIKWEITRPETAPEITEITLKRMREIKCPG